MIHSFRGLERAMELWQINSLEKAMWSLLPRWQNFNNTPSDETVGQLIHDCSAFLKQRADVDGKNLGLTGFCAGGRYTMLFLPQDERNVQLRSRLVWLPLLRWLP